ncbi:MAG: hypothetical protein RLO18_11930, partial [Gimesia chilikensis]
PETTAVKWGFREEVSHQEMAGDKSELTAFAFSITCNSRCFINLNSCWNFANTDENGVTIDAVMSGIWRSKD